LIRRSLRWKTLLWNCSGVLVFTSVLGPVFPCRSFGQAGMASPHHEAPPTKARSRLSNPPSISLQDIALVAGLNFHHASGEPLQKKYLLESTGGGVAIFDFDGDGLPDIFLVNGDRWNTATGAARPVSRLYKNLGHLRFKDVTRESGLTSQGWGQGACVGDYDNEGKEDLFLTYYGHNVLYHNDGQGHFTDVTQKAGLPISGNRWNTGCSFFDYDRDGLLDIAVANYVRFDRESTPEASNSCEFKGLPVVCGPRGLPGGRNILYRNQGNGTFKDVSAESHFDNPAGHYCFSTIAGDFDGDGWPDVFLACDSTPNILLRNNHDGTFTDIAIQMGVAFNENGEEQGSMGADAADFNHTGQMSLIVTTFDDDIPALFLHDGDNYFTDVSRRTGLGYRTHQVGWGVAFVDFDNDGWQDIFVANGHVYPNIDQLKGGSHFRQEKNIYYNLRDGTFADITEQSGPGTRLRTAARGLAYGDLDNTGSLDIVVNNLDSPASLFQNQGKKANWIAFKLVGTRSNRDAIGARVTLTSGKLLQTAEVRSGCCYMSQSDMRLHFGLGAASKVDKVDVRWPNGVVERFSAPTINTFQLLTEGSGTSVSP
jgi:enediyne biosynthesis protein E4